MPTPHPYGGNGWGSGTPCDFLAATSLFVIGGHRETLVLSLPDFALVHKAKSTEFES